MRAAIPAIVVVVAACAPEYVERDTQLRFDPTAGDFWALPLPSDLRLQSGAPDFDRWPGEWNSELVAMWLLAANERVRGWGLSTGGFFVATDDIDPATLTDDSAFLVDIDPTSPEHGRRFPLEREFRSAGDLYAPERLLSLSPVPGHVRRSKTRYAFIVTDDVRDVHGARIGASRALFDMIDDLGLGDIGIDKARIAGAAVFTTQDADAQLLEVAAFAESLPVPTITQEFVALEENDDFVLYQGATRFPVIQEGKRPYTRPGEGRMTRPIHVVEEQEVRLLVTIPKRAMPSNGFPLVIYMHGSGGDAFEGIDLGPGVAGGGPDAPRTGPARVFAQKGVAMLSTDFPLHGTRHDPPDTSGLKLYNILGNINATIDNFHVAAMEQLLLTKLASEIVVDGARFDPEHLTSMGFSMGSTIGIPAAAVDPRLKGFIGAGAGGNLIEIVLSARQPNELKPFFETLLGVELHAGHPLLHAFQTLWDQVDPIVKAKRLVLEPFDGMPRKHVFLSAGYLDGYFSPRSTTAMAIAMGTPLVGAAAEPLIDEIDKTEFPVVRNMNGVTSAVLSYEGTAAMRGHYVLFDRDDARQQYTCFATNFRIDVATELGESCAW